MNTGCRYCTCTLYALTFSAKISVMKKISVEGKGNVTSVEGEGTAVEGEGSVTSVEGEDRIFVFV